MVPLIVQNLNEDRLRASLWKDGQHKSLRGRVQCTDSSWIVDCLQGSEELKVSQVVHVYFLAHNDDNFIFAQFDSEHRLAHYNLIYFT